MQLDQIKELYEYNNRANERLWEALGGLSVDQLNVDMHSGIGSIFSTIVHMVNASWTWCSRWEGSMPTQVLLVADFPTLQSIRTRWQEEEELMQSFLATSHDNEQFFQ